MFSDKKVLDKISTLDQLVEVLLKGDFQDAIDQSPEFKFNESEFEKFAHWNEDHYTRNCIAFNESFELILLCWEEGQKTAVHCHNEQECFVKVVSGEFNEAMYTLDPATGEMLSAGSHSLATQEVTSIENHELFHSLKNTHSGRAMSLHLYMKPIERCRYYDPKTKELNTVGLSYYSLDGKLL